MEPTSIAKAQKRFVRDSDPAEGTMSISSAISLGDSDDQNLWADGEVHSIWEG